MEELRELYTVSEVAQILGVSQKSVRDFINAGELRAVKVGQWRISKDSIQSFMDARSNHYRAKANADVKEFIENSCPMEEGQNRTLIIRDYNTSDPQIHGEFVSLLIQQLPEESVIQWRYYFDKDIDRARHIFTGDFKIIVQLLEQLDEKMGEE